MTIDLKKLESDSSLTSWTSCLLLLLELLANWCFVFWLLCQWRWPSTACCHRLLHLPEQTPPCSPPFSTWGLRRPTKRYGVAQRVAWLTMRWGEGPPVSRRIDEYNKWPLILASKFSFVVKINLKWISLEEERGKKYGLAQRVLRWQQRWREGPPVLWRNNQRLAYPQPRPLCAQDEPQVHVMSWGGERVRRSQLRCFGNYHCPPCCSQHEDASRRNKGHKDVWTSQVFQQMTMIEGWWRDSSPLKNSYVAHLLLTTWCKCMLIVGVMKISLFGLHYKAWRGSRARSGWPTH